MTSINLLETGRMFGQYEIIKQVDQGGMATVYKAYQVAMGREVAIKILPREFAGDQEFYNRFQQEARLIAKLEHPHILPVYDFGEQDGIPFIAMRYMEGGTLRELIKNNSLTLLDINRIFTQLAQALSHAHASGVIHRDIKPSNMLIDQYGNAYLTDFGIAKLIESTTRLTPTGAITGTPAYISPEQARGDHQPDHRSDIYAMGILLYEMFTGHVPYDADSPLMMLMRKVNEPPTPPSVYRPDLPPSIEVVILKALATNPDERYPSMDAFLVAWQNALIQVEGIHLDSEEEGGMLITDNASFTRQTGSTYLPMGFRQEIVNKPKRSLSPWVWTLIGMVIFAFFAGTGAYVYYTYFQTPTPLPTTHAAAVQFVVVSATPLPDAVVTPGVTSVPEVIITNTSIPTPEFTPTISVTPTQSSVMSKMRIFGPMNGDLKHSADDKIQTYFSGTKVKNFSTIATFINPYSAGIGRWDLSFHFRTEEDGDGYWLILRSDSTWQLLDHRHTELEEKTIPVSKGVLDGLDPRTGSTNSIALIVLDDQGFFYLNGTFISKLDLSKRMNEGDIAVGTGYYPGSQIIGERTRFENFTIWRLEPIFGPKSGNLIHNPKSPVIIDETNVNLWNFIAVARFENPYPSVLNPWSIGFTFRSEDIGDQYRLIAQSNSMWKLGEYKNELITWIRQNRPDNLKLAPGEKNELFLLAWGDKGLFYVNGQLLGKLDISNRKYPGDIGIGTGFSGSDMVEGKETRYEDFTVWGLP